MIVENSGRANLIKLFDFETVGVWISTADVNDVT